MQFVKKYVLLKRDDPITRFATQTVAVEQGLMVVHKNDFKSTRFTDNTRGWWNSVITKTVKIRISENLMGERRVHLQTYFQAKGKGATGV